MSLVAYAVILTAATIIVIGLIRAYGLLLHHFLGAAFEFAVVWTFSNIPLLVMAFILMAKTEQPGGLIEYFAAVFSHLQYSEVLIYTSAILAPVIYIFLVDFQQKHRILKFIYMLFILVSLLVALGVYSLEVESLTYANELVRYTSIVIYVGAMVAWFVALVYERRFSEGPDLQDQTSSLKLLEKVRGERHD